MIHGLSERRQLPRAGRVKLGRMVQEPGRKAHPIATKFFVVEPEVAEVFGDEPTELRIAFAWDSPELVFPQSYKCYRASGLWCAGDGIKARRWISKGPGHEPDLVERPCPCEFLEQGLNGEEEPACGADAELKFLLPEVAAGTGAEWWLRLGNPRSIVSINTTLDHYVRLLGSLRGVPFLLKLEPVQTQRPDKKSGTMVKHTAYVVRLDSPYSLMQIREWRLARGLPVGPEADAGAAVAARARARAPGRCRGRRRRG